MIILEKEGRIGGIITLDRKEGCVCAMNSLLWMGHGQSLCSNRRGRFEAMGQLHIDECF